VGLSPTILYRCVRNEAAARCECTYVSPNITSKLGYEYHACLQQGWWESHVHPDDLDAVNKIKDGLRHLDDVQMTYRFEDISGHWHWLQDELHIRRDTQGKPLELIGSWMDVTASQALQEQYRTLFETSADAIMMLNEMGFIAANASTLKLFHCASQDDFIGRHPADLSPEYQPCGTASRSMAAEHIDMAMKQGTHHFEWVHQGCDGRSFPTDVLLTRLMVNNETVLQATVRDLSQQKREEKLRTDRIQILSMIADRACALDDVIKAIVLATETYADDMQWHCHWQQCRFLWHGGISR